MKNSIVEPNILNSRGKGVLLQLIRKIDLSQIYPPDTYVVDYAKNPEECLRFFHFRPDQVNERIISIQNQPFPHRGELVEHLYHFHQNLGAAGQTLQNIKSLNNPKSLVIMTGQQPGLLTGPIYTIYKTISCLWEAQRIQKTFDRPCIPVFWIASEDHHLQESTSIFWPDRDSKDGYRELSIQPKRGHFKQPVGLLPLRGKNVDSFRHELDVLSTLPKYGRKAMHLIQSTMEQSSTLGEWFSRLMLALFGPSGLVLVEPQAANIKKLARPIWERILSEPLLLPELVEQSGQKLERLGYKRQLSTSQLRNNQCPFFLYENHRRERVIWDGHLFHTQNQGYSRHQLHEIFQLQPERFSPNVYIRPILSELLFPTLLYMAGPGEIGYFAQIKEVYDYFGLKMPILIPRFSASLREVEPTIQHPISRDLLENTYGQERKLNFFYLLNYYGFNILKALQAMRIDDFFFHYQIDLSEE